MSAPYTVNFLRVRNNVDFYRIFTIKSKASPSADPVAIDLSSATLFMKWKPALGGSPVVSLAVGTGITKLDAAAGKISVLIDSADMADIAAGKYKYDLVMVRSGLSETIMEGYVKVVDGVTAL